MSETGRSKREQSLLPAEAKNTPSERSLKTPVPASARSKVDSARSQLSHQNLEGSVRSRRERNSVSCCNSARSEDGTPAGTQRSRASQRSRSVLEIDAQQHVPGLGNFSYACVPGYTGFVPGKYSENVFAATYKRANELSMNACESRGAPFTGPESRWNPSGLHYRAGIDTVGYQGFIPGKYADNVFGNVFAKENKISQAVKLQQAHEREAMKAKFMAKAQSNLDPNDRGVLGYSGFYSVYNNST